VAETLWLKAKEAVIFLRLTLSPPALRFPVAFVPLTVAGQRWIYTTFP